MGQATVIVADDQATSREHLTRLLSGAGYRVVSAFDGTQALRAIRRERPDLAILDVVMPNQGAPEVCAQVRADAELGYIPIMFVSSRSDTRERVRGLRAGADDFLGKPYDDEEMLARVEALLRIKRMLDAAVREASARHDTADQTRDALTGVWSASYLDERLESELQRASRHNEPLSLAVIELEGRRDLVAAEGDTAAEPMIIAAAEAITRCTRGMDVVTRCDGLAFAVILPNTHFAGAVATSDRMWRALADTELPPLEGNASERHLRASIGVACYPNRLVRQGAELLEYARSALQRADAEGPARICLFQHQAYIFQPE